MNIEICPKCNGTGLITCWRCQGISACDYCRGFGKVYCPDCDGSGVSDIDNFMVNVEELTGYVSRKEFQKAISFAHTILKIAPPSAPATAFIYNIIGTSQHFLGNNEEAIRWLKKAIEVSEGTDILEACASAHDALGVIYSHQGNWSNAVEEFKRTLELIPENETYKSHLNQALQKTWD